MAASNRNYPSFYQQQPPAYSAQAPDCGYWNQLPPPPQRGGRGRGRGRGRGQRGARGGGRGGAVNTTDPKVREVHTDAPAFKSEEKSPVTRGLPSDSCLPPPDDAVHSINFRPQFSPSLTGFEDVVRCTWDQVTIQASTLIRQLTFEEFRYYCYQLLWVWIIRAKQLLEVQVLNAVEQDLLADVIDAGWYVPRPVSVFLSSLGAARSVGGEELTPIFPPLPQVVVNGYGGFHAPMVDEDSHTVYEEVPCVGTALSILAWSTENEGQPPNPVPVGLIGDLNANFLGFDIVAPRNQYQRGQFLTFGITIDGVAGMVPVTGISRAYLTAFSAALGQASDKIKLDMYQVGKQQREGSSALLVLDTIAHGGQQPFSRNVFNARALSKEETSSFGGSFFGLFQQVRSDVNELQAINVWSCVTFPEPDAIPDQYFATRNARRNLPPPYLLPRFASNAQDRLAYLRKAIVTLLE